MNSDQHVKKKSEVMRKVMVNKVHPLNDNYIFIAMLHRNLENLEMQENTKERV